MDTVFKRLIPIDEIYSRVRSLAANHTTLSGWALDRGVFEILSSALKIMLEVQRVSGLNSDTVSNSHWQIRSACMTVAQQRGGFRPNMTDNPYFAKEVADEIFRLLMDYSLDEDGFHTSMFHSITDLRDLEVEGLRMEFKTLSHKAHYLVLTIDGEWSEGFFRSKRTISALKWAAGYGFKIFTMVGPAKYVRIIKIAGGLFKARKLIKEILTEEAEKLDIRKESNIQVIESYITDNLEELVLKKVLEKI